MEQVGRARDATLRPPVWGLVGHQQPALTAKVDHASVNLEVQIIDQRYQLGHTTAAASIVLGRAPQFRVRPASAASLKDLLVGAKDLVIGDPAFDAAFLISARDAVTMEAVLTPSVREQMLERFRGASLECDGRRLTLRVRGADHSAAGLAQMIELVAEIASHGVRELEAIARLSGAALEGGGGRPRVKLQGDGVPVTVEIVNDDGRLTARATCALSEPRAACTIRIGAGGVEHAPPGTLSEAALGVAAQVGAATLSIEGDRATLAWAQVPTSERARAGADLLSEVARGAPGGGGAFR